MSDTTADDFPPDKSSDVVVVHENVNWPARIAKWLLAALLGLIVIVGLLMVAINTGPGRNFVAGKIAGLQFANGMKIGVGRIDGSIYGKMTIHDFTLSDPRGVFFRAPLVKVDWRPFEYFGNHVDVKSLTAPTATLLRTPQFTVTPPSNAPLLPNMDISVGHFRIDRLIIDKAVTGERRIGSVEGAAQIANRRAQVHLDASVIGGAGRAGGDRLALNLDAVPEKNKLDLNLFLSAPKGGVLAKMAGLTAPLAVHITGKGDWKHWDGRLLADLDNAPLARLSVTARNGTFGVRGPTEVARLVTGPTAALLGPVTNVAVQSTWANRRADLNGRIGSDAFTLVANGGVDLGRSRFDKLHVNFALLKPSTVAPNVGARNVRVAATLSGAMAKPGVDYHVTADRLTFNGTGIVGLDARGVTSFASDHIRVPVTARARAITGLDTVAGGTLTNVGLDGDLAVSWPRIMSDNLKIRSNRIDATAVVLANVATGLYSGALQGTVDNYRLSSVGIFNLTTNAHLKSLANGGISLVGKIRARSTRLFNSSVESFLGGNFILSSDVAYGPDGVIRFSSLRLGAPQLRVTGGSGSYSPSGRINLHATGVSKQYGPVAVQVTGTIANPHAIVSASKPGLGLGITGLHANIQSIGSGYRLAASGNSKYGAFTADVVLNTAAGPVSLDIRKASIAGIDISGRVRQSPSGPFVGQLQANGQGLVGTVALSAAGSYQQLIAHIRANNAMLPAPAGIAVDRAIVDARITLYNQPEVIADAQLAGARIGGTRISALRAIVDYRNGAGSAKLLAEGNAGVPFRVAVNAELQPNLWRAAVKGRANGVNFRTGTPARIVPNTGSYELQPTQILLDRGEILLAGNYGQNLQLQARASKVDLALIDSFAPGLGAGGLASGTIDFVKQPNAFPNADVRLAIRDFRRTTAGSVSKPIDVNLLARLDSQRADLSAVMRTRGTVIGRIQAIAEPLGPGRSWTERISAAPVSGGIRYIGPADTLFSFAGLTDQQLSGPLGVAADFHCQVSKPCLTGVVRGKGLTYRNATYGTRLTAMSLSGRFTGDRLEIQQLTADAGNGTVTGSGYISLAAASGYPAKFDLTLDRAQLANSDDLKATASGSLSLVKAPNQAPVLTGTVHLPMTRYQIVRQGSATVPTLTGVHFKPPRGRPVVTGDAAPAGPGSFSDVTLDLHIVADNAIYVSGMGLESEWSANLHVTGTASSPDIRGSFDLIRGTLGFAGRSFALQSGRIRFVGSSSSSAQISLSADETIADVVATVNVSGSVGDPHIAFTSAPGLPQDEILSRILFGNSVGSLSAIQAVQLAASLNSLRGSGGGLNPLGKLRSATGFDRLRILGADATTGRKTALAAGKYITNDIYLEIVTDARGFTATQLEITLSPALSVLSQVAGSNSSNVSVRYKKTY